MIILQSFVLMLLFMHWISFLDHQTLFILGSWFIHLTSFLYHQNIKRQSLIFFIHFYILIQWQVTMGVYFFCFPIFLGLHKKTVWISLTNISIISHLIITIFDLLTFIFNPSKILLIYFNLITFIIQVLL